ncbi:MAG: hypothetical protein CVV64_15240 [Candidatus Wallbacteria bacterium HGW-Wallbacteria-1]|jgi:replicative DNA helicase|uniref:SF4 helicase domain-containing protein n=1 Tax=Candidatus Wallbacteria bacterium HGW-Wallbacteria-1 TaxID=2013854 RepID=A0A2N1PLP5_9BACT|nr:MAG: hypothetical protein CVV64_15240 [Candidatus Wallbacteria bacterium HGW-Wallbacteria-1]
MAKRSDSDISISDNLTNGHEIMNPSSSPDRDTVSALTSVHRIMAAFMERPAKVLNCMKRVSFTSADLPETMFGERRILDAMSKLAGRGEILDSSTITASVLESMGGTSCDPVTEKSLARLFEAQTDPWAVTDEEISGLMSTIKALGLKKRGITECRRIISLLEKADPEMVQTELTRGSSRLRELLSGRSNTALRNMEEAIAELRALEFRLKEGREALAGYPTGFPILTDKIGGFENELYLFAGAAGMGKSTLMIQFAWQLAQENEDLYVIFVSLDHRLIDVTTKIVSQSGQISAKYVKNPFIPDITMEQKRQDAIDAASSLRERMHILDESHGCVELGHLENLVQFAREGGWEKVALVVDSVMKLDSGLNHSIPQRQERIATFLKGLSRREEIPVIVSLDLPGDCHRFAPTKEHLAVYPSFLYEPYVVGLLYCDFVNNFETPFLEWEWNTEDMMVPVTELNIIKNKMDEFRGKLFYRFYNSMSFFRECVKDEMDNYGDMLENLQEWKDRPVHLQGPGPVGPPPPAPVNLPRKE